MERYDNDDSIRYRTDDSIKIDSNCYQLLLELGVHNYAGEPSFFANIIGTRYTTEGWVYRSIYEHYMDKELDSHRFINCYDMMNLFHYIADHKKKGEIIHRLFSVFVKKPALEEEENFIKNGRFAWFKQYLPKMAKLEV